MEARNIKAVSEKHDITYHRLRNWIQEGLVSINPADNTIPMEEDEKITFIKSAFDSAAQKGSRLKNEEVKQMLENEFASKRKSEQEMDKKQEVLLTNAVESSFKNMGLDEVMLEFAQKSNQLITKEDLAAFVQRLETEARIMIREEVKSVLNEELPSILAEQLKLLDNPEKKKKIETLEAELAAFIQQFQEVKSSNEELPAILAEQLNSLDNPEEKKKIEALEAELAATKEIVTRFEAKFDQLLAERASEPPKQRKSIWDFFKKRE